MVQKCHCLLWAKGHSNWSVAKRKSVLWSDKCKFNILFENHGHHVRWTKKERDFPAHYQRSVQKPPSPMVWGCIAYAMGSLHIWKSTISVEKYVQVSEQHMLPSRWRTFQERLCIFQQGSTKPHTASMTTIWLCSRGVQVLKWPVCSSDLLPIEDIWHILKRKIQHRRPTFEQLESYIRQERDKFHLPKLQQQVSSVPRQLQTVMLYRGKHSPVPPFLRHVAAINSLLKHYNLILVLWDLHIIAFCFYVDFA